jgi:hypothetical protein
MAIHLCEGQQAGTKPVDEKNDLVVLLGVWRRFRYRPSGIDPSQANREKIELTAYRNCDFLGNLF